MSAGPWGIRATAGALRTHVRSEDVTKREIRDANNHRQKMLVVNERGLDALILGGRLHAAPFFKGYITGVMLPSIRGLKPGSLALCGDRVRCLCPQPLWSEP